jgi:hypothetical protein
MTCLATACSLRLVCRIAASLLVALALGVSAVAFAELAQNCGEAYKAMLSTIERKKPTLSSEAQLARQRMALRLYSACQTGHLEHPGELFDKLDRNRY